MAALLAAVNKLRLELLQHLYNLLTHGFTQRVRLTTCEAGKQTAQKHHLLLINCNAVCIFKILLHYRYVIHYRLTPLLTLNELRNIVHRARAIEGVHGYKVFKHSRLQLTQILLHTW